MKQTVIKIDENLCIGCGACVKSCHSGILQIIDGKARTVNEIHCDKLGACIGECPVDAITLEEIETESVKFCCNSSSSIRQFPIQLRLVTLNIPFLKNMDLILAADCTAFVYSNFHNQFIKKKRIVIACPKLDNSIEFYVSKLTAIIDNAEFNTLTVILMEVPCCKGLWYIAQQAVANARRTISVKKVVIGINGDIL